MEKSVMIFGADIPLNNREQFDIAFANAKKMTDDLNVQLIPVETNYREIFNCNWMDCFSSLVTGVLNFFSKNYFTGVHASDYAVNIIKLKHGQHPAIDRYFSSDTFRCITDGYEHNRTERAALIKDWKIGIDNLRVCWRNKDKSKNCGMCEKCIRTKLNFKVNGINHLPTMPKDFSFSDLKNLKIDNHLVYYYFEILDYAKIHKTMSNAEIKQLEDFAMAQEEVIRYNTLGKNEVLILTNANSKKNNQFLIFKGLIKQFILCNFNKVLKKIFCARNEYSNNKKYKIITILGIKLKFKVKNKANFVTAREKNSFT